MCARISKPSALPFADRLIIVNGSTTSKYFLSLDTKREVKDAKHEMMPCQVKNDFLKKENDYLLPISVTASTSSKKVVTGGEQIFVHYAVATDLPHRTAD